jgi:hypothetical protein
MPMTSCIGSDNSRIEQLILDQNWAFRSMEILHQRAVYLSTCKYWYGHYVLDPKTMPQNIFAKLKEFSDCCLASLISSIIDFFLGGSSIIYK